MVTSNNNNNPIHHSGQTMMQTDETPDNLWRKVKLTSIAINSNYSDYNLYCRRATLYAKLGMYRLSLDDSSKAISLNGFKFDAYLNQTNAFVGMKMYTEAEQVLLQLRNQSACNNFDDQLVQQQLTRLRFLAVKQIGFDEQTSEAASKRFSCVSDAIDGVLNMDLDVSPIESSSSSSSSSTTTTTTNTVASIQQQSSVAPIVSTNNIGNNNMLMMNSSTLPIVYTHNPITFDQTKSTFGQTINNQNNQPSLPKEDHFHSSNITTSTLNNNLNHNLVIQSSFLQPATSIGSVATTTTSTSQPSVNSFSQQQHSIASIHADQHLNAPTMISNNIVTNIIKITTPKKSKSKRKNLYGDLLSEGIQSTNSSLNMNENHHQPYHLQHHHHYQQQLQQHHNHFQGSSPSKMAYKPLPEISGDQTINNSLNHDHESNADLLGGSIASTPLNGDVQQSFFPPSHSMDLQQSLNDDLYFANNDTKHLSSHTSFNNQMDAEMSSQLDNQFEGQTMDTFSSMAQQNSHHHLHHHHQQQHRSGQSKFADSKSLYQTNSEATMIDNNNRTPIDQSFSDQSTAKMPDFTPIKNMLRDIDNDFFSNDFNTSPFSRSSNSSCCLMESLSTPKIHEKCVGSQLSIASSKPEVIKDLMKDLSDTPEKSSIISFSPLSSPSKQLVPPSPRMFSSPRATNNHTTITSSSTTTTRTNAANNTNHTLTTNFITTSLSHPPSSSYTSGSKVIKNTQSSFKPDSNGSSSDVSSNGNSNNNSTTTSSSSSTSNLNGNLNVFDSVQPLQQFDNTNQISTPSPFQPSTPKHSQTRRQSKPKSSRNHSHAIKSIHHQQQQQQENERPPTPQSTKSLSTIDNPSLQNFIGKLTDGKYVVLDVKHIQPKKRGRIRKTTTMTTVGSRSLTRKTTHNNTSAINLTSSTTITPLSSNSLSDNVQMNPNSPINLITVRNPATSFNNQHHHHHNGVRSDAEVQPLQNTTDLMLPSSPLHPPPPPPPPSHPGSSTTITTQLPISKTLNPYSRSCKKDEEYIERTIIGNQVYVRKIASKAAIGNKMLQNRKVVKKVLNESSEKVTDGSCSTFDPVALAKPVSKSINNTTTTNHNNNNNNNNSTMMTSTLLKKQTSKET